MNIEILSFLTDEIKGRNNQLIIGTHNGIFHSDEVLACAILCLFNSDNSIQILRTRDFEMLTKCDICVDIGGGTFDHHQKGFNKTRNNGIKYASAGLVWNAYGKQLISLILKKYFSSANCNIDDIFNIFDSQIITFVDCEDNGISTETHCFSFISSFLPLWFNNTQDDFNNQFYMILITTMMVLEQELKTIIGKEIAKETIVSNWNSKTYFNNGILEIPSQTIDWVETVVNINISTKFNKVNFVISPYPLLLLLSISLLVL